MCNCCSHFTLLNPTLQYPTIPFYSQFACSVFFHSPSPDPLFLYSAAQNEVNIRPRPDAHFMRHFLCIFLTRLNMHLCIYAFVIHVKSFVVWHCCAKQQYHTIQVLKSRHQQEQNLHSMKTPDFQPESRWFRPAWSLPLYCFLRQETLLHVVSLHPGV